MSPRLRDHLNAARHRRFVGRAAERSLFRCALRDAGPPFHVLYIFGPGGTGKTALLEEYARTCERHHTRAIYLDGRNVEPSSESFAATLKLAMGVDSQEQPLEVLASYPGRQVILIDAYERLAPLDGWVRSVFLPQLPENVVVVLAGIDPPAPAWHADPGWQTLIRTVSLRNLSPKESRAYLTRRQIPAEQHQAILNFTHGHPLALSLVADVFAQRQDVTFQPEAVPDVIKMLLERLVQKVPGPAHRAALDACALVRVMTEALLADMLAVPDVHELFEWLRGLSFIEAERGGLAPHDLTREALNADLRWRNPDWYAELHRRARAYYAKRLQQSHGLEQQRILLDYIYLHRDNMLVRPFFEWQASGNVLPDVVREAERPALEAMVSQHEGKASARLMSRWLAQQPKSTLVFHTTDGQPAGFVMALELHQASVKDINADPAARAAWRYLQDRSPLRPGEGATLFRFWMSRDTYQSVSSIQSLIFVNMVRHYLTTPGLAFTFVPCTDPEFWAPMFAYADLERIPEADFQVGERHYGAFGHDWRARPPAVWLAWLAEREIASEPRTMSSQHVNETLAVLSQAEFAGAIHDALRDLTRPDQLRTNSLLCSRVVVERAGPEASEAKRLPALQSLMQEAVESLRSSPRHAKFYQALYHTYIQPASNQERAAEIMDVPFSTYRRHLKAGIAQVVEFLWQREIGGLEK